MNTRLQVEHPVTEEITGLDLVEQMIRVAAGEKLAFTQADVGINGWSIETRVYAEDPYRGFLPSTGRLVRYQPPPQVLRDAASTSSAAPQDERKEGHANPLILSRGLSGGEGSVSKDRLAVRVDDGVAEGGEVSMFYDPMIAKLITWAPTRLEAIDRQVEALDAFRIEGIGHNVDFLSALMQHPRFREGNITTGFIAEEYPDGFNGAPADATLIADLAVVAALAGYESDARAGAVSGQLNGRAPTPELRIVRLAGAEHRVRLIPTRGGLLVHLDDNGPHELIGRLHPGQGLFRGAIDGRERTVRVARTGRRWRLTTRGASHLADVLPAHVAALSRFMIEKAPPDLSRFLICPMPGLLTRLDVKAGDHVEAGQPLAVVEAMKMENILRAEKAGTVKAVKAAPGESLAVDAVILEFE
jgi:propionyl-CoA carboxylase alpha chain